MRAVNRQQRLVDNLAVKLKHKAEDVRIFKTDETDPTSMPDADLYVFSAPTEAFNIQKNMRSFMKNLHGMEEKKYATINTHSMNKNWLKKMDKLLSKKNMVKVAAIDFQVGKNAQTGNGLPENWEAKIDEFAAKL